MAGRHPAGSQSALSRWTKLAAVVPLVLMTGAWTAAFASPQAPLVRQQPVGLPEVPTTAFSQPASNPSPVVKPLGVDPKAGPTGILTRLDDTGIPAPTVTAYKRSEQVLAGSDATCKMPWTLVAAIGRVESNHGRYGGNRVAANGVSTPGIYGIALDGSRNTARITDTDQGALDNDTTFDRAVGPMQFIPGTWRAVAVDGDNDGSKNPQDINDAALAAGVYLCAGAGDLSTPDGAKAAVLRYNHSSSYAELVLSIAARYAAGDFDSTDLPAPVVPADEAPAPEEPAGDDTVVAARKPAAIKADQAPKKITRTQRPAAKPVKEQAAPAAGDNSGSGDNNDDNDNNSGDNNDGSGSGDDGDSGEDGSGGSGDDGSGSGDDGDSGEDGSGGSGEDGSGSGDDGDSGEDGSGGSGEDGDSGEDGSGGSGDDGDSGEDGSGEDGSGEDGSGEDETQPQEPTEPREPEPCYTDADGDGTATPSKDGDPKGEGCLPPCDEKADPESTEPSPKCYNEDKSVQPAKP